MGKVYSRFQTKTAQKTLPEGVAHTYIAYVREFPPPPVPPLIPGWWEEARRTYPDGDLIFLSVDSMALND